MIAQAHRLLEEAAACHAVGRFAEALAAASRAVAAAQEPALLIQARDVEATCLRMLGDPAAALSRYTWILSQAGTFRSPSPDHATGLLRQIASAYMEWVECARLLPGMPLDRLLAVLDEGEAWLEAVGRSAWRAGLLAQRAELLDLLGRTAEALGLAEEAIALASTDPDAPGFTIGSLRVALGRLLARTGRLDDARAQFWLVFGEPTSGPYDTFAAHEGLGRLRLLQGDSSEALRYAQAACRLATAMGWEVLCPALSLLADAQVGCGDLDMAAATADRFLEAARNTGSENRLYFALRQAADLATRRADHDRARALLAEARPLAERMDRSTGTQEHRAALQELSSKLPS